MSDQRLREIEARIVLAKELSRVNGGKPSEYYDMGPDLFYLLAEVQRSTASPIDGFEIEENEP